MIEIWDTEASLDEKEWSALLKFQTASKNFDSGYGYDNNINSISMWHYNQQDRFVMKVSRYKGKRLMFPALQLIFPIVVRYYEQKYVWFLVSGT